MFIAQMPTQEIVSQIFSVHPQLIAKLKNWDPELDEKKLELIEHHSVIWNDGSLGCPMPGRCYTQALVPGYLIRYYYCGDLIEVHTDQWMRSFAIPGWGFI